MEAQVIIDKYYGEQAALLEILVKHSRSVANMALEIAHRHPELHADEQFLFEASMLHDIGIIYTDAPGIQCFGTEAYIRHGLIGGELLRKEGFPCHARVAERHTGTGITATAIRIQHLPLPIGDYIPETIEEQIICYADKFFSKSHLDIKRTPEQVLRSLEKFGDEGIARMRAWMQRFG